MNDASIVYLQNENQLRNTILTLMCTVDALHGMMAQLNCESFSLIVTSDRNVDGRIYVYQMESVKFLLC